MVFDNAPTFDVRRVFQAMWWIVATRGVLMVLFGILMVAWPETALVAFVWLFGIYAILDGVTSLVHVWRTRSHVGLGLALGIVSIVAGVVALVWPQATAVVMLFILAAWILLLGIVQIAAGIGVRKIPGSGWGWLVASGVAAVVLGVVLFAAPVSGLFVILGFAGALTIISGIALLIAAFYARRVANRAR